MRAYDRIVAHKIDKYSFERRRALFGILFGGFEMIVRSLSRSMLVLGIPLVLSLLLMRSLRAQATSYVGTSIGYTFTHPFPEVSALVCPCDFILLDPLPAGIYPVTGTDSITLSGTPSVITARANYRYNVRDKNGTYGVWSLSLEVKATPQIALRPSGPLPAFPPAVQGQPFAVQLTANGPAGGPCTFDSTASAGALVGYGFPADLSSGLLSTKLFASLLPANTPGMTLKIGCGTPIPNYPIDLTTTPETSKAADITTQPLQAAAKIAFLGTYDGLCSHQFSDCEWQYQLIGGIEQSDLSAQSSATLGFVNFFVRAPANTRLGSIWLRARFLGSPNTSSTQNIVTVATDPAGTLSSSSLSSVGSAVDYVIGLEHDYFQPKRVKNDGSLGMSNPGSGQFTLGVIAGFGATSPLSSQSATVAYAVPVYGTNECSQVNGRYGPSNTVHYQDPLPSQSSTPGGLIQTTTTAGSNAPTVVTSGPFCVINPTPTISQTTSNGVVTTTATTGTVLTTLAFSPEDRSSFLLKYGVGVRLISRFPHTPKTSLAGCFHETPCSRSVVDFTLGQDQAITGGHLRSLVFKSDALFPILNTGVFFFGSASIRTQQNATLPPLILTPVPLAATATAGSVTVPSPSVFVLPLKQANRDFYRIGIGLDLSKILPKLFKTN